MLHSVDRMCLLPQLNAALQRSGTLRQLAAHLEEFLKVPAAFALLLQGLADNAEQHRVVYLAILALLLQPGRHQQVRVLPYASHRG